MWQFPDREIGARLQDDGLCRFRVWAPLIPQLDLHLLDPVDRVVPMDQAEDGYHTAAIPYLHPGTRYFYRFPDGRERPDPASRAQPQGVHGPSAVVGDHTHWTDHAWQGIALAEYIIYELHIGTFSAAGTFDGAIDHLPDLVDLGITAIEVMPIGQFPGARNWGYDGVDLFAVQQNYGGSQGFARFVDACHAHQLAVILDVVYNHVGPEGNYLSEFGPYFTDTYQTPWGQAVNFDGPANDEVRAFFIQNALMWVRDFHVDALRLDAVHAIMDFSAHPFLADLAAVVHAYTERVQRPLYLIAESDQNDPRLLDDPDHNGLGLDAQWSDEFHHAVHTLLTGEHNGYYRDYGRFDHLVSALRDTFVYAGTYSPARQRRHGASALHLDAGRFIFALQNHDQIGNRMLGERLGHLVDYPAARLAAALLFFAPGIPLIFMGEEYGEDHPFLYFIDHGDPALIAAVREGRKQEFAAYQAEGEPPDPADPATFIAAKLDWQSMHQGAHHALRALYQRLIHLRRTVAPLRQPSRSALLVTDFPASQTIAVRRWDGDQEVIAIFHLDTHVTTATIPWPLGTWNRAIDAAQFAGDDPQGENVVQFPATIASTGEVVFTMQPRAFALYIRER